jgi:DNA-binding XRE family transcriptional regulator
MESGTVVPSAAEPPPTPLRNARLMLGLSQGELAKLAGVKKQTVHELEVGRIRHPRWCDVFRLTHGLRQAGLKGVTPEQIFPVELAA